MKQHQKMTSPTSSSTVNPKIKKLLQMIDWPTPPSTVEHFNFSTSPKKSEYRLWNPQESYKVGEKLQVVITARDHYGHPKEYGGDFFRVKLHNPVLKAGVTGQVNDYGNGSYLATFLLPWPGEAHIHIILFHSSEAVDILKKKRENYPEKVYFKGYFYYNGSGEVVECNLEIKGKDVCKYRDPVSGDTWQCVRPKKLPCDSWIHHSMGGTRTVTNAQEDSLLSGSVTFQVIKGSIPPIKVNSDNSSVALTANLPPCKPGLESPTPSGYYYLNSWVSLTCSARHFPRPADALACLKGKDIHMFGDSTLRQWFEYLEMFIPSLKRIDLHGTYKSGPLLAVEPNAGVALRMRAHGLPLRTSKTMVADLHYESADLSRIGGGPQTVIVITLFAHFTTYPVMVYLERLERVRQAVESLLSRSPQTTVIIKSANTGSSAVHISDWLFLQLDILLRATFKRMAVTIIDVWDMTSCHYLPNNLHPGPEVIRNEVDLFLSYICPK
ncbi:NXPE family member 3-like [Rana temporaria]|uniref:NXPE family member 3-like n=1 Tax=Rana temporaria TaxID=8407 RepID=UPI001AAC8C31|nr:NXPE family member 3-like [Rana temporaria]